MRNKPNGGHLNLSFSDQKSSSHLNSQIQQNVITEILKKADIEIIQKMVHETQDSLNFVFMFKQQGHLAYNSDNTSLSINIFTRSFDQVTLLEALLMDEFEWSKCTTNVNLLVNNINKVQFRDQMMNINSDNSSIHYDVGYIKREQTPYQELRIYDTHTMGRILVVDDFINISDKYMVDDYTRELPRMITRQAENNELQNVLIIGGGDCLIANYLLKNYPNIKKVTVAEIDRRVIENIYEHFNKLSDWVLDENFKSRRLVVHYVDGSAFVKTQPENFYDGIVIDSTDCFSEDSPAYVLTTPQFYKDIKRILKKNCAFSQMMSHANLRGWFVERMKQGGFNGRLEFFDCPTPEWLGTTPLGYIFKDDDQ